MESAPDAFVVTDLVGNVLTANRAFLQLAQVSNEALVRGESLERWLGRAGVDLSVLLSNLRQRDVVRLFATRMRGDYGSTTDVEIFCGGGDDRRAAMPGLYHPRCGFALGQ
jgi:PAS domain-containing protein